MSGDLKFGILLSLKDVFSKNAKKAVDGMKGMKAGAEGVIGKMNTLEASVNAFAGAQIFQKARAGFEGLIAPAAQFEELMSQVKTRLNETGADTGALGKQLSNMSVTFGSTAQEQASGFFQALDDGAQGSADAFDIMTASNKLAKAGVVGFGESMKAIQDTLNSYGKTGKDAAHVAEVFLKMDIAGAGIGVQEIARFMQTTTPIAAELGVGLEEVSAIVGTMTSHGIKARAAFTSVTSVLVALQEHGKELKPFLKAIGSDSIESAIKTHGLVNILESLNSAAGANEETLGQLGLSGKPFLNFLKVTGQNLPDLIKNLKDMQTDTGVLDQKFQEATDNNMFRWKQLQASIAQTKLEIGTRLMVVLEPVITKMLDLAKAASVWIDQNPKIATAIGVVVAGLTGLAVILGVVVALVGGLALFLSPVAIIVMKIVLVVGLLVAAFYAVKAAITAFSDESNATAQAIKGAWNSVVTYLVDAWTVFADFISPLFSWISDMAVNAAQTFKDGFMRAFDFIGDRVNSLIEKIKDALTFIYKISGLSNVLDSKAGKAVTGTVAAVGNGIVDYLKGPGADHAMYKTELPMGNSTVHDKAAQIRWEQRAAANRELTTVKNTGGIAAANAAGNITVNVPPAKIVPTEVKMDGKAVGKIWFDVLQSNQMRGANA